MARRRNSGVQSVEIMVDDKQASAAIRRMREDVRDLRKLGAWDVVEEAVFDANRTVFGMVSGPPLSKPYAKWKQAHGGGALLVLRGDLREQVTERTSKQSGGGHGQKITRGFRRYTLSTTWPTAHLHMRTRPFINTHTEVYDKALSDAFAAIAQKWAADFGKGA